MLYWGNSFAQTSKNKRLQLQANMKRRIKTNDGHKMDIRHTYKFWRILITEVFTYTDKCFCILRCRALTMPEKHKNTWIRRHLGEREKEKKNNFLSVIFQIKSQRNNLKANTTYPLHWSFIYLIPSFSISFLS